ncbi:class I SAM-dependent methyltransferase [Pedobacter sp. SYSU D00535]|uniref:class I SAM-dependent methyltransferase n=1 Tax=Pedobacter sp. SYSU D00535 TaxID=2810308 RepID=UPI001A965F27|nr:class I SAM-dependent methyltransferase [Pedobacter sp. SYSU D00535]
MEEVKNQFDAISKEYDRQRPYLIPCFHDFYTACYPLVKRMSAAKSLLDLGAGTGLFSYFVYLIRPELDFTLVDLSPEMLNAARERFKGLKNFSFLELNFATEPFPGKFDIIISALSIHHLDDEEKRLLYKNAFEALNDGGLFINADQVLGRGPGFDSFYKESWMEAVKDSGLEPVAINNAFQRIQLDKFAPLEAQISMLEEAGFSEADCIYKNQNFAVFAGTKGNVF